MAWGDITPAIDTEDIAVTGHNPQRAIQVSGDVHAQVYEGRGSDGYCATFTLDSLGAVSMPIVTLEFDLQHGRIPVMLHISGHIFAVACGGGAAGDFFIYTLNIPDDGSAITVVHSRNLDNTVVGGIWSRGHNFLHISGNVYAFAYQGLNSNWWVRTFTISDIGVIGASIDTLNDATNQNKSISFIHCAGDMYALATAQALFDTEIHTFTIDTVGNISAVLNTMVVCLPAGGYVQIVPVYDNIYAFSYKDPLPGALGNLITFTINPTTGAFGAIIDDSLAGATIPLQTSDFLKLVYNPYFICVYTDGIDEWVLTLEIANDGTIGAVIDTQVFPSIAGASGSLYHRGGDIWLLSHTAGLSRCRLESFGVEKPTGFPSVTTDAATGVV